MLSNCIFGDEKGETEFSNRRASSRAFGSEVLLLDPRYGEA
jgi:hypothetical protein